MRLKKNIKSIMIVSVVSVVIISGVMLVFYKVSIVSSNKDNHVSTESYESTLSDDEQLEHEGYTHVEEEVSVTEKEFNELEGEEEADKLEQVGDSSLTLEDVINSHKDQLESIANSLSSYDSENIKDDYEEFKGDTEEGVVENSKENSESSVTIENYGVGLIFNNIFGGSTVNVTPDSISINFEIGEKASIEIASGNSDSFYKEFCDTHKAGVSSEYKNCTIEVINELAYKAEVTFESDSEYVTLIYTKYKELSEGVYAKVVTQGLDESYTDQLLDNIHVLRE